MTDNNGTCGIKRGEFPDGEATVLVLERFQNTWESYGARVPEECNLLFVRDTAAAEQAMQENSAIGVVIAQGLSRRTTNAVVDSMEVSNLEEGSALLYGWLVKHERAGEPVFDWLDNYQHTLAFLKSLQQQGFEGLVQVVSHSLSDYEWQQLLAVEGLRVQGMSKRNFFEGTFTSKVGGLWKRIAARERFERSLTRPLSPNSPAVRYIDQLLEQAIYPHPTEERLYEDWFAHDAQRTTSSRKSTVLEEILTWLNELKLTIASGDVRAIYGRASQMPERSEACECNSLATEPSDRGWWLTFHFLHGDFNRAVWEIVDMAGLTEWMRLELELDLASRNPTLPEFGHNMSHEFGRSLREFFRPAGPSGQWVRF
jgi:hypothetical protein